MKQKINWRTKIKTTVVVNPLTLTLAESFPFWIPALAVVCWSVEVSVLAGVDVEVEVDEPVVNWVSSFMFSSNVTLANGVLLSSTLTGDGHPHCPSYS